MAKKHKGGSAPVPKGNQTRTGPQKMALEVTPKKPKGTRRAMFLRPGFETVNMSASQ